MRPLFCILILLLVTHNAAAQETTWPKLVVHNATYHNARLLKVEPDGIRIMHDTGASKIEFENLPTDLQQTFNLQPDQAIEHRTALAKTRKEEFENAERIRKILRKKELETVHFSQLKYRYMVVQITHVYPDGSLLCHRYHEGGPVGETARVVNALRKPCQRVYHVPSYVEWDKPLYVTGVKTHHAEGDILRGRAARAGSKEIDGRTLPWIVSQSN
ncbi:hypothetical protein FEM03_11130 [Phragmitibacter flavus]|uniref:Uncharacterized protein n=1 Tax=Phragmitibacter flavus TaxID=2576071 RepID=A0A5R8KEZ0_9BACT|nr:hypothetical protein [Phragmitibacter flavus]TLD70852.1 hypothetical protein FEM03_11130 [Phragmitibacter flavus]